MGNCSLKGSSAVEAPNSIRIITDFGGIIQLQAPKFVGEVLGDFPGHGIFRRGHGVSAPLLHHEKLLGGRFYYLLPLEDGAGSRSKEVAKEPEPGRMSSSATAAAAALDVINNLSAVKVLPPPEKGVWKVKLVIDTKQLGEILSEEGNTEALIEQMRLAASSAGVTPKRTKIIRWGEWAGNWRPNLGIAFKGSPVDRRRRERLPDFCIFTPGQGKGNN
ncbi:hypothetical protein U1Q18_019795 [Sarracenia purpurea var. burkii]